jgi:ribosomal protein S18 acetylase RimI-like enzyme
MNLRIRPTTQADLAWVTDLERRPDHVDVIGQWSDAEHLEAIEGRNGREHWIIEREGRRAGYLIAYDCTSKAAGIYVKRILIDEKERRTGQAALSAYLDEAFAREGVDCVWLIVRNGNDRAEAVYRKLGFDRFTPGVEEAARYDAVAEAPMAKCFRMRRSRGR